jgi:hypothetical protein
LSHDEAQRALTDAKAIVPVILTRIELWRTEDLIPLERNPRRHSEEQIAEIAASMREFGFLWPIMVNGETRGGEWSLPGCSPPRTPDGARGGGASPDADPAASVHHRRH